jgi:hypothetical protein
MYMPAAMMRHVSQPIILLFLYGRVRDVFLELNGDTHG